jgi:hypothetical protein
MITGGRVRTCFTMPARGAGRHAEICRINYDAAWRYWRVGLGADWVYAPENVRASIQDSAALRAPALTHRAIGASLHPANKPKDESDENDGSEEAADIHRNFSLQ